MEAEWRSVKGYEDQYEVSSQGLVRSLDREVISLSRWGTPRVLTVRGRIIRPWKTKSGYMCVSLNSESVGVNFQVHRLVASAFLGDPGDKHVNHIDGNKLNNVPSNMEYVTPKENTAHAIASGLMPVTGEENPSSRYSTEQIRKAHALVSTGSTYAAACESTGIKMGTLVNVLHGKNWQSLGLPVIRRMARRAMPALILLLATPAFAGPDDDAVAIQIAIANATTPTLAAPLRSTPPVVISVVKPAKASGYPSRSQSGRTWTGCPDYRHLLSGEHAGQFDAAWLASLSPSQVQALHADAHEGRVQTQFVISPTRKLGSIANQDCPSGRCPSPSRTYYSRSGLFRRR